MQIQAPDSRWFSNRMKTFKVNVSKPKEPVVTGNAVIDNFRRQQAEGSTRTEEIMSKFRAGQKLTVEEMQYLDEHDPKLAEEVRRMAMERERLEQEMEQAKTKRECQSKPALAFCNVEETSKNGYEMMARISQMKNAANTYMSSAGYRAKPLDETELKELKEKKRRLREGADSPELIFEEEAGEIRRLLEELGGMEREDPYWPERENEKDKQPDEDDVRPFFAGAQISVPEQQTMEKKIRELYKSNGTAKQPKTKEHVDIAL